MKAIPTIDIGSARSGSLADKERLAREIEDVARNVGFMYVVNHGIDPSLISNVFEASRKFHAQPMEEKLKIFQNEWRRGYQPPNSSQLKASTKFAAATKPSSRAALVVRQEIDTNHPNYNPDYPMQGPNQWPADPAIKAAVQTYNKAMTGLGKSLLPIFSLALGREPGFLDAFFDPPVTTLSLLHYAPTPNRAEDEFGSAPHTDYGFITILAQGEIGGLEVQDTDGNWVYAPPVEGSYVLNIGDVLGRWTNDQFRSTPHRVINRDPTRERYSVPFFFDPALGAQIEVLPEFADQHSAEKYPPIAFGDYFSGRLKANFVGDKQKAGAAS